MIRVYSSYLHDLFLCIIYLCRTLDTPLSYLCSFPVQAGLGAYIQLSSRSRYSWRTPFGLNVISGNDSGLNTSTFVANVALNSSSVRCHAGTSSDLEYMLFLLEILKLENSMLLISAYSLLWYKQLFLYLFLKL